MTISDDSKRWLRLGPRARVVAISPLLVVSLLSQGCTTIETFTTDWDSEPCTFYGFERPALPWTYSGTRWAWFVSTHVSPFYQFDLPLSLVADTLALPFTIPKQSLDGDLAPRCDQEGSSGLGALRILATARLYVPIIHLPADD